MTEKPIYAPNYKIVGNCLLEIRNSKQGSYDRKLCNFLPWIVSEITLDDGVETTTRIRLRGVHESGRTLPEIEIPADDLGNFNWIAKHWGMDCILEVGQSVKDSVRYAIQTTAKYASRQTVYAVTGWKKVNGVWEYLLPGSDSITVSLPGKLGGYRMERECTYPDILVVEAMLRQRVAPPKVQLPLMAFVFLSPLNEFLRRAGCVPKFVLFLIGKTGSRKSTLAALMLSFFGRFTASELPLSFRDTGNSIIHNAFTLKDVLTCIDDFYPGSAQEEKKLTATAQSIMRSYGDRQGRGRLKADATPMEPRPPQGNAIVTGEFPPDIGESGTARYFALELREGDVDLQTLSAFQKEAAKGTLQHCMFGYVQWLKERFLCDGKTEREFVSMLGQTFEKCRNDFLSSGIRCHGRVPEMVAWLEIGMRMLLMFLLERNVITDEQSDSFYNTYQTMLYDLARKQADSIVEDKPTRKFLRKLYALLESGQACLLKRDYRYDFIPNSFVGYEDEDYLYLNKDITHKLVKKLCEEQGESFSISARGLLSALVEEGIAEPGRDQNTKTLRVGEKNIRLMWVKKSAARRIVDGG